MARVFDASWQRPAADDPRLSPGDGLIFYVSRTADKCPTTAEVAAHRAAGHVVRRVFEDAAGRASTGSYADGAADGRLTLTTMQHDGHTKGEPAYYACDTNEPLSLDYARGFGDGLGDYYDPRCYGGDRNLARAESVGQRLGWQASAASWSDYWDFGAAHGAYAGASLYQVAGPSPIPGTDLNIINHPAWAGGNGATVSATGPENWDGPDWAAFIERFDDRLADHLGPSAVTNPNSILNTGVAKRIGLDRRADLARMVNPAKLAGAIVAALPAGQPVTEAELEQALRNVLGSLG